ncbi:MAG: hypothetical protein HKN41_08550 [Ilumatobacter sp.]|nr:hypothetical protein [Ilumatobacter sp.]
MPVRSLLTWAAIALLVGCADAPTPAVAPASPPSSASTSATPSSTSMTNPAVTVPGSTLESGPPPSGRVTTATGTAAMPTVPTVPPVIPDGFATGTAVVTKADGETCEVCVWLATDADQRARGLMQVTDLGGPVGMAFVYPSPHTGTFWMKDTRLPLSIAYFSPEGDFVEAYDMEPCRLGDQCPKYRTPVDFLVAVEVPQGTLADLGLLPGSRFELLGEPCPTASG